MDENYGNEVENEGDNNLLEQDPPDVYVREDDSGEEDEEDNNIVIEQINGEKRNEGNDIEQIMTLGIILIFDSFG